jgi:altronate dehydratase
MSEASDSERCEGVAVEEGVVGEANQIIVIPVTICISPVTFEVNMRIMEYFSLFYLKSRENIPLKNYN